MFQILFGFSINYFNVFESYLDSGVGIVDDKFIVLQRHHYYYLTHFIFEKSNSVPIYLYSLFLQSFIQWSEFKGPNSLIGLKL
jgi:hypothetical protein